MLAVGQTGCFFGVKIGKNDFSIVPLECFIASESGGFTKDLAEARRLGRVLGNLDDALKAKDADGSGVAAAHLLVLRSTFVPFRHGETGTATPLDAEQSKRALLALADADGEKHGRELRESVQWLHLAGKLDSPPAQDLPIDPLAARCRACASMRRRIACIA